MKLILATVLLAVTLYTHQVASQCQPTLTTASGRYRPQGTLCHNQVIFDETFDWFNMDLWEHEENMNGGGNGEFQWYTNSRRNSYTDNGILYIRPTLTTDVIPDLTNCQINIPNCWSGCSHTCSANRPAPPVQSALIKTYQTFAFKYGRIEIRAKTPTGDWLWPALWMMPKHSVYGGWPRSGEIDIMESKGNTQLYNNAGQNIGNEEFGNTLHFGTESWNSAWWAAWFSRHSPPGQGWNRGFHLYQMEWAPSHFSFSINNQWIGTIATGDGYFRRGQFTGYNPWANGGLDAPFDQEFYFIFNLAIGGTNGFFPNSGNVGGKPWVNNSQYPIRDFWNGRSQWLPTWNLGVNTPYDASFQIDRVRVWAL